MIPLDDFQVEAGRAGFPAAERYAGGAFSVLPALILMEAIDAGLPESAGTGVAAVLPFFFHLLMGRRRTIQEG